jgi:hypothetical protein
MRRKSFLERVKEIVKNGKWIHGIDYEGLAWGVEEVMKEPKIGGGSV